MTSYLDAARQSTVVDSVLRHESLSAGEYRQFRNLPKELRAHSDEARSNFANDEEAPQHWRVLDGACRFGAGRRARHGSPSGSLIERIDGEVSAGKCGSDSQVEFVTLLDDDIVEAVALLKHGDASCASRSASAQIRQARERG
jgi:hypothetical protein